MYAVVGCGECHALWIRTGEAETATCPRCQKRHPVDRLRPLARAETAEAAREARSRLLAARADAPEAGAEHAATADAIASVGFAEDEYLAARGIDPAAVREPAAPAGGDRRETVLRAIERASPPTRGAILSLASGDGVSEGAAAAMLDRLVADGVVLEAEGTYRRL